MEKKKGVRGGRKLVFNVQSTMTVRGGGVGGEQLISIKATPYPINLLSHKAIFYCSSLMKSKPKWLFTPCGAQNLREEKCTFLLCKY